MVTLRPKKGKSSAHVDLLVEDGGPIEGNLETRRECQKAAQLERPSNPRCRGFLLVPGTDNPVRGENPPWPAEVFRLRRAADECRCRTHSQIFIFSKFTVFIVPVEFLNFEIDITSLKGIVQRKLRSVESGVNR
jgi:hypothetical protein